MDTYIMNSPSADVITPDQISIENRLDIIDEAIRKKYLARLSEMPIASRVLRAVNTGLLVTHIRLNRCCRESRV